DGEREAKAPGPPAGNSISNTAERNENLDMSAAAGPPHVTSQPRPHRATRRRSALASAAAAVLRLNGGTRPTTRRNPDARAISCFHLSRHRFGFECLGPTGRFAATENLHEQQRNYGHHR